MSISPALYNQLQCGYQCGSRQLGRMFLWGRLLDTDHWKDWSKNGSFIWTRVEINHTSFARVLGKQRILKTTYIPLPLLCLLHSTHISDPQCYWQGTDLERKAGPRKVTERAYFTILYNLAFSWDMLRHFWPWCQEAHPCPGLQNQYPLPLPHKYHCHAEALLNLLQNTKLN